MGLSTAIRLLEAGYKVDIVARDLPGDPLSIEYTSPWAVRLSRFLRVKPHGKANRYRTSKRERTTSV